MRIHVVGGGPAGLLFAYAVKRAFAAYTVKVFEQNGPDVTFGFGVVLSGVALEFLKAAAPDLVDHMAGRLQSWSDQHIVVHGERVVIDGSAFAGVERIVLLDGLQQHCRDAGVELAFSQRINDLTPLQDCDLLVAADGANSMVRDSLADVFGTRAQDLQNYYAWYGVETAYDAHTLTFMDTPSGVFTGHHYRYKPAMSTFVPEVDDETWMRSGMNVMSGDERRELIETVFADALHGQPLRTNRSLWRRSRMVKNLAWSHQNIVLIGDALRTAHFSIGSGTRLAMEDSIALWQALVDAPGEVATVLELYEARRRPVREKLNSAAENSIAWYEAIGEKIKLSPYDFAYDYLMRTGVMTPERLDRYSPKFMQTYRHTRLAA